MVQINSHINFDSILFTYFTYFKILKPIEKTTE